MRGRGATVGGTNFGIELHAASYYSTALGAAATLLLVQGTMHCRQFTVSRAGTVATIGLEITTAGTAGSVVRLGLYQDDGVDAPATLIVDAGTIDGTQAPGLYEITVNQALAAGRYWAVVAQQGAPATATTVRSSAAAPTGVSLWHPTGLTLSGAQSVIGYTVAAVTGALPPTAGALTPTLNTGSMPRPMLKAA